MSKGEITRSAILEAARRMSTQVGLDRLSIGALAAALDLSKSGLFAHFQSKERLQVDVIEYAAARFAETVVGPAIVQPRGEPRVRALYRNWMRWGEDETQNPGGCIFVAASTEFDDRPGAVKDALAASQKALVDTLARAAQLAIREGHFREGLDCEQFAQDLFGVVLGYHHFRRLIGDPQARRRADAGFEALVAAARAAPSFPASPPRASASAGRRTSTRRS
jgi:AcrR family transcriptional regulator